VPRWGSAGRCRLSRMASLSASPIVDAGYLCHSNTQIPNHPRKPEVRSRPKGDRLPYSVATERSEVATQKVEEEHSSQAIRHSGFGFLWVFGCLGISSFNGTPKHLTPVLKTFELVPFPSIYWSLLCFHVLVSAEAMGLCMFCGYV